jgi:hypothetical protein
MMSERPDQRSTGESDQRSKAEKINDKLDEFASKASGPDVAYGSSPRSDRASSDDELKRTADQEGVSLYRHADGSHEAIDESEAAAEFDDASTTDSDDRGESPSRG